MMHTRLVVLPALVLGLVAGCRRGPAQTTTPAATVAAVAPIASHAPAGIETVPGTPQSRTVTGSVAETMNSGGYTYVRLATGQDDVWIASTELAVKIGERLTAPLEMRLQDFHSTTLDRDFPVIYFVSQVARAAETLPVQPDQRAASAAGAMSPSSAAPASLIARVAPAPGGMSIADVWAKRESLAGKPVVVRGKVMKVNDGILDRNWLHVQDGSGSVAARTHDLTVTTAAAVKVGDIVTASGTLGIGKDFGAGYAYEAILEKATVTPN